MATMFKLIVFIIVFGGIAVGASQFDFARLNSNEVNHEKMTLRLELFTTNIEATVTFYREVLGFEMLPTSSSTYQPIGKGNVILGIGSLESLSEDHHFNPDRSDNPFGYGVEIVLEVDDVHMAYKRALSAGAPLEGKLGKRPWGLTDFRVTDPNGYYIRITSKP
ncbi:hypothetical protein RB2501_10897 [Robiginitalea biformata HTCC2501]|uniref:VOC domain-containing protein n=2 Tax=Robiginitalea TaxID=252306 RepID=A4CMD6_ROBBH|nr:hypothetical protein RB2501_10897 [Robiginitalea biformata HTCC2501]